MPFVVFLVTQFEFNLLYVCSIDILLLLLQCSFMLSFPFYFQTTIKKAPENKYLFRIQNNKVYYFIIAMSHCHARSLAHRHDTSNSWIDWFCILVRSFGGFCMKKKNQKTPINMNATSCLISRSIQKRERHLFDKIDSLCVRHAWQECVNGRKHERTIQMLIIIVCMLTQKLRIKWGLSWIDWDWLGVSVSVGVE